MAALVLFNSLGENVAEKKIDLSGTLKLALTNSAPAAANTQLSDIAQIAAGGGYSTGGFALTVSSSAQSAGLYKLVLADLVITATGNMGQWRYGVIYDDGATGDLLIGYVDSGSARDMQGGDIFTWDFDASTGVLQGALS